MPIHRTEVNPYRYCSFTRAIATNFHAYHLFFSATGFSTKLWKKSLVQ
ncbi:MAG: hypothetical protein IH934_00940 [Nanoarchaeota archaeon]|nr:hypothetical protein [Nanoarchaeota archaeon]